MTDDQHLRARFAALRQQSEGPVPSFDVVLCRARRSPLRRLRWLAWASSLVAFAIVVAAVHLTTPHPVRQELKGVDSMLSWKAPTDFLLGMPGEEMLRTMPTIGEMPAPLPAPASAPTPITMPSTSSLEKFA